MMQSKPLQSLRKTYWQLYAFGLTPTRLPLRAFNGATPALLCTSIPKAGTNLVLRALCLHPQLFRRLSRTVTDPNLTGYGPFETLLAKLRHGQVLATHLRFTPERAAAIGASGTRHVFVVRDPRDVVVSTVFYALREQDHYLHKLFANAATLQEQLALAIRGDRAIGYQSIGDRLADSAGWLQPPNHVVRFEDLVGGQGGGSDTLQKQTLRALFSFAGVEASDKIVDQVAAQLFSKATRTFRKGRIGQWREYFDAELTTLFKEVAGDELVRYGYEAGLDW